MARQAFSTQTLLVRRINSLFVLVFSWFVDNKKNLYHWAYPLSLTCFRFVNKAGIWAGNSLQSLDSLCACGERYVLLKPLKPCDNMSVCVCVSKQCEACSMHRDRRVRRETDAVLVKIHHVDVTWSEKSIALGCCSASLTYVGIRDGVEGDQWRTRWLSWSGQVLNIMFFMRGQSLYLCNHKGKCYS